MKRRSFALAAFFGLAAIHVMAQPGLLPPEQAFRIALGAVGPGTVEVKFRAEKGYYLYADRFQFQPDNPAVEVVRVVLPAGDTKYDEVFGRDVTYFRGDVTAYVTLKGPGVPFKLLVRSQGCADVGVCYPPVTKTFAVSSKHS